MSLAGSNFARMRASMAIVAGILSATVWSATALGADKITFLTSWFAQAEHGGFYQAKATGLYEKAGLDVTIKMGGPQVNGTAASARRRDRRHDGLRLPGAQDRWSRACRSSPSRRRSSSTCRASWRTTTSQSLADLKDKTILVATPGRTTWWPWLKAQIRIHRRADQALHLQPAAVLRRQERRAAILSVVGAVPGQAARACRSSSSCSRDDGYPPYGTTMVATRGFVDKNPDVRARAS